MTQLLLTHATPGDLEQFCLPLLRDLQALQDASPRESDRFCAAMRKVTASCARASPSGRFRRSTTCCGSGGRDSRRSPAAFAAMERFLAGNGEDAATSVTAFRLLEELG